MLGVIAFRSPMPAELAGSERTPEGAWSFAGGTEVPPERVTVTERHRARLDQDQVRGAQTGEARIIAGAESRLFASCKRTSTRPRAARPESRSPA